MSALPPEQAPGKPKAARRLGRNRNGYLGDTINIDAVLGEILAHAHQEGWTVDPLSAPAKQDLFALRRTGTSPSQRVYLSAGIHGDEPAGPLAIRELVVRNRWPAAQELWVCPCLNPAGFRLSRRENPEGTDLNRQYRQPTAVETAAHVRWLEQQPRFDLCLCLHEDWESHGFYLYELNPDGQRSLAEVMLSEAARFCPLDHSEVIEGRPAKGGLIKPSADPRSRPDWPEAFYLLTHKTRLSYTLEAPSDFELQVRVDALVASVEAALTAFSARTA